MKKLRISLIINNLVVDKTLTAITMLMHNFIAKFRKILAIYKEFAGNRVNELGNIPRRGVVPKFSDLEVIALSATAEALGIDSENLLFRRLEAERGDFLPNLISCRQYNQHRKLTSKLGEDIRRDIAAAMDGREDCSASIPSQSKYARTPVPSVASWGVTTLSARRRGDIAHRKACTIMGINSTQSAG